MTVQPLPYNSRMNSNSTGRLGLALTIILVLGCHSVPLKSPVDTTVKVHSEWLKNYKEAQLLKITAPFRSCEIYKQLGADTKFPAHQLAQLRAWEICEPAQAPTFARESLPPWLKDMGLDIALQLAAKSGDKAAELELAGEKSKQNLPQSEKLKWNELALQRARELKAQDKIPALIKRQYTIAPRLNPEPASKQWLAVAGDLRNSRKFDQAREYYEKILKSSDFLLEDKVAAFKGIRLSYKNARQHEDHLTASLRLVDFLRKAEKRQPKSQTVRKLSYDSEVYYGRALWTLGRADDARKVFETIERRLKGRTSLAELYWLMGRMAEEQNRPDLVSRHMESALKEKLTDPELRDKILWYSAWNERQQKNSARAAEILTELDAGTKSDFTKVRALFWLGKTYAEMDKPADAKRVLEQVIEMDSLGYYGLLAHRQLGVAISFKRSPVTASAEDPASALPLDVTLAEWLSLIDEGDALSNVLQQSALAYRKQKDQSNEAWTTLFQLYAKGGLYTKMYETLSSLDSDRRKSIVETHPELLFPQPWNDDVKLASLDYNVDEELIYGIMRQESAFDPRARSGADAFGLMQVLPEIAENIAFQKKISYLHMDDLYQPKTNIPIGAAHIRELLDRHKGRFILAVASYNASEKAILNWMKTRYRGDSLEFIEEIPYEETRTYVRLVMRNLIFYSLLKSKSASIEFPAWVLKLDPS